MSAIGTMDQVCYAYGTKGAHTGRVREEHDEAVYTNSPASRWWQPVLEPAIQLTPILLSRWMYSRVDERVINTLRFIVTLLLLSHLQRGWV